MKILSLGNFSGRGWDGSVTDENHIADALEELGHEVTRWQREEKYLPFDIKTEPTNRESVFDFVLVAQWDGYGERLIEMLHSHPTFGPAVYWAFDYQADGQEWHERLVAKADLYLSKRIADSKYPNWQFLSQDFAPSFLDKYPLSIDKDIDVLFTGSYLDWAGERNATLKAVDDKFSLVIHSVNEWPGFKDVRPPIMDEGLPELYARAKVILSIDHTLEAGYYSDRNAQIICCGRRPLFRYVPLSEARFGDRVSYFYSVQDCLEKIERMLAFPELFSDSPSTEGLYVNDRVKDLLTIVESIL